MNGTGKEIVAKVLVFVTVSSSVFALSSASASASPEPSPEPSNYIDKWDPSHRTHLLVEGDQTHWVYRAECVGDSYLRHLEGKLPNGREINSGPDSDHPQTLSASGAGAGPVSARCSKMTTPGHYESAGDVSDSVY